MCLFHYAVPRGKGGEEEWKQVFKTVGGHVAVSDPVGGRSRPWHDAVGVGHRGGELEGQDDRLGPAGFLRLLRDEDQGPLEELCRVLPRHQTRVIQSVCAYAFAAGRLFLAQLLGHSQGSVPLAQALNDLVR
jgi:hypothetical protein